MPVMLELPAPEPQAEPTRLPFCLRPQVIRIFAAVCKFLLELVIMILYLPPGTPATARNLGLAGARGCIYLAISGLGYSLVLTIQSQGNPDQATWITSTVNDALGVPSLSCQPLMRQKRGTLDFLFKADEVTTVSPTMPDSIIRTTLQPAIRVSKAAHGKALIIGSNSSSSQPLDPRKKQETEVFQNTTTHNQSLPLTEGPETPSNPTHATNPTSPAVVTTDLPEPDHDLLPAVSTGHPCTVLQEQTVFDLRKQLDNFKKQLKGQTDLVTQYNAVLSSTKAKQERLENDLSKQTNKVHQLTTKLGRQVELVAQYDASLTLTEEKKEVLTANLHKQNQTVLELKAELARQKDSNQATAGLTACLEKLQPSATTGIPDAPKFPSQPVSTAHPTRRASTATTASTSARSATPTMEMPTEEVGPQILQTDQEKLTNNPSSTGLKALTAVEVPEEATHVPSTPPDLVFEILRATGFAILVLIMLILWGLTWLCGFRMGARHEKQKIRHQLDQTPANLNMEIANPPILKKVKSVGKTNESLAAFVEVDLTTGDLSAGI